MDLDGNQMLMAMMGLGQLEKEAMVVTEIVQMTAHGKKDTGEIRRAVSLGLHIDGRRKWMYGENVFYTKPDPSPEEVVCMMRFYDGVDKL